MKIIVHDFAGHPFQFQLSQELARRGHEVMHAYFADLPGPKGKLTVEQEETGRLTIEPLRVSKRFDRYSYVQRLAAHYQYVNVLRKKIRQFQPDVVISGNMPTDAQYRLRAECGRQNIRFVHWIQDFYAAALETLFTRKLGPLGHLGAVPFHLLERRIFAAADAVVYISDDFSKHAEASNYRPKRSVVIENWASLEDLPQCPKDNPWSRKHQLQGKFTFLYSGTLGLKHNPEMLAQLARKFKARSEVRIVLVSEGIGRQYLENCKQKENLSNLLLFDYQAYADLPNVFGAADVLLANVDPDSSLFSVPSKILSYLCAGRPILAAIPRQNLASRVIERAQAGYVVDPSDSDQFLDRAEGMLSNPELCAQLGRNARTYSEATFDIRYIGDAFEAVLKGGHPETFPLASPVAVGES